MTPPIRSRVFEPYRLGPLELRNRIVKAATFEGMTPDNLPTDQLVDFHRTFAAGGVAMTTVAFSAVSADGRGAPREMIVSAEAVPGLREVADAVHAEGAAAQIQLGHAGPVAAGVGTRALTPSRMFSPLTMSRTTAATTDDLRDVVRNFADAARHAREAGFDSVEVHAGHHYLLSAFHSPKWNRRTDAYGGSIEHRARLTLEILDAVRSAVGDSLAVTVKLNMVDAVPGGTRLAESIDIAQLIEAQGVVDAIQLTGGGSFGNPMYLFRGDPPIREMANRMPPPANVGFRLAGSAFLKNYPFEEAYFLPLARRVREHVSLPLVLLGGVTRRSTAERALDEGFELVALGRALLCEPDLAGRWHDEDVQASCVHCNLCMPTIYSGTHCVLVDEPDRPGLRVREHVG